MDCLLPPLASSQERETSNDIARDQVSVSGRDLKNSMFVHLIKPNAQTP